MFGFEDCATLAVSAASECFLGVICVSHLTTHLSILSLNTVGSILLYSTCESAARVAL